MGQSSGSVGPAIGGSPFGGLRVLSPMDIARASPQYDPYTASRRPNYMPYGPNQQFYQPIYQPSYSQFSPMGYGQAPFGGFYQPPMMGFGQRFGNQMLQQPQRQNMFGPATDISDQGQAALRQMPQPMLSPQPMQSQYRPIPYMTQTQLDSRQRAAEAAKVRRSLASASTQLRQALDDALAVATDIEQKTQAVADKTQSVKDGI